MARYCLMAWYLVLARLTLTDIVLTMSFNRKTKKNVSPDSLMLDSLLSDSAENVIHKQVNCSHFR